MPIRFAFFISLIASLGLAHITSAQTYYVAPGGNLSLSSNINAPGDIEFAFQNAPSGSQVYVKAGNYGQINLVVANDNTTFTGYTYAPGDLDASALPQSDTDYDLNTYSNLYPTIDRQDVAGGGTLITANHDYVTVENFHLANGASALTASGERNEFINIVAANFGNPNNSYHGWGYNIYGDYNVIDHCFLLNAGAQGYTLKGDYNELTNSSAYANDTTGYAPTDYYMLITPNSGTSRATGNIIENCYIERVGNLAHSGHGFCITTFYIHQSCSTNLYCYNPIYKDDEAYDNVIRNSTSNNVGEPVLLRGPGVHDNNLNNLTSLSYGGWTLTTGCHHNTFTSCKLKDSYFYDNPNSTSLGFNAGVEFFASGWADTTDQGVSYSGIGTYPWQQEVAAEGNRFINCLFENVSAGILMSSYSEHYDPLGNPVDRVNRKIIKDNEFINCTFIGRDDTVDCFMYAMRGNTGNKMINCIISGFDHFESRYFPESMSSGAITSHSIVPSDYTYDHCNFYNNGFNAQILSTGTVAPVGIPYSDGFNETVGGTFVACNTMDPGFADPLNSDYHLVDNGNSGTIDMGISLSDMIALGHQVDYDLDSADRPCGSQYDIGAYEFTGCANSIDDLEAGSITTVFPNPSNGTFYVSLTGPGAQQALELYSSSGQRVGSYTVPSGGQLTLDLSQMPSGLYYLRSESGQVHKLMKL